MYAIIETGGKQYKVTPGQAIDVERLDVAEGKSIEIDRVLLLADGEKITTGNPLVEGARVIGTSLGEKKGEKVVIFRYKAKVRHHNKIGHRQLHTRLKIDSILGPGEIAEPAKKPRRRVKKEVETEKEVTESGS